jgi:regulator of cell morphogenesis and NO signaling
MVPFSPDTPVREVLHAAPQTLTVLERHHLDYCCGGARPLAEACHRAGADLPTVLRALEEAAAGPRSESSHLPPETLGVRALVEHVLSVHHTVTRRANEVLPALAAKVATVHGGAHPELRRVREIVEALFHELAAHMAREEQMLFPYLVALTDAEAKGTRRPRPPFETAARPIHVMRMDHDAAGSLLAELAELTGGFALPPEACTSWRALYEGLEAHQKDLMRHVWIENELLFPKAIELERRLDAR